MLSHRRSRPWDAILAVRRIDSRYPAKNAVGREVSSDYPEERGEELIVERT